MNPSISIESHHDYNPRRERKFTLHFFDNHTIQTTVTSTPSVVRKWVRHSIHIHRYLRRKLVVGLGVQWRAPYNTSASTLQLCVGSRCLIFQLRHARGQIPRILERFLEDPDVTFVGIRNHSDGRMLRKHGLEVATLLDLCDVADGRNLSMEGLAERVLGYEGVCKCVSVGMSNWNAKRLSDEQVLYASVDAVVSFLVGVELEAWRLNS
ncbi:Bifunctional 3'-5' exonuclease/ATP-dependent helicase WRN [Linum grandiflorum]